MRLSGRLPDPVDVFGGMDTEKRLPVRHLGGNVQKPGSDSGFFEHPVYGFQPFWAFRVAVAGVMIEKPRIGHDAGGFRFHGVVVF